VETVRELFLFADMTRPATHGSRRRVVGNSARARSCGSYARQAPVNRSGIFDGVDILVAREAILVRVSLEAPEALGKGPEPA